MNSSILIVSATQEEINPLKTNLKKVENFNSNCESFKFNNISIDIVITGVGMVATAFALGKTLTLKKYDLVLNIGIAGSFNNDIRIGDVVSVVNEQFSELGVEDNNCFIPIHKLNMSLLNNSENGILKNNSSIENKVLNDLRKVSGITVNTVHGNIDSIEKIKKELNPDIETMEGASAFYTCLSEKINFAEIRSISNFIEPRDKSKWNIPLAIKNLNEKVFEIIKAF